MKEIDFDDTSPPAPPNYGPARYGERRTYGFWDSPRVSPAHGAEFVRKSSRTSSDRFIAYNNYPRTESLFARAMRQAQDQAGPRALAGGNRTTLSRSASDCSPWHPAHTELANTQRMSEGRKAQILLLDERRFEILIQPKLYTIELLELVSSHFNLKEKEYFGLAYKDDTGHNFWLQLDKRVLEHEFPKKGGTLVLHFFVRFFVESISFLRDNATIELFYLQAKQSVFKGSVECDADTVFELAAQLLQATHGDFYDEEVARKQLKKLPVLPTSALKEHPSLPYCEERVLGHYRKLEGQTRGASIVNYMTIIEGLPTYGIHYYEVKDKSGLPWWLGLSHRGISLYDHNDKRTPRRVFAWKQLENLYFRDKKFSIEVHDPKRIVHTLSSFNLYEDAIQETFEDFDDLTDAISDPTTQVSVSRRTFGPGNVNVHAWFCSSQVLTKCIWSMAVNQHQFYLDHKHSRPQLPQVRSMSEIASDLCRSSTSLHSSSAASAGGEEGISRSNSAHSLTTAGGNFCTINSNHSASQLSSEESEATREAQRDMYAALKARQSALEEALRKKTEQLKAICLKEAELTGVLPLEMPLVDGDPVPQVRKRVGTAFSLSSALLNRTDPQEEEDLLAAVELDYEIQDKIVKAAHKLALDPTVARNVRKQRRTSYQRAHTKLKDLEKKVNDHRQHAGIVPVHAAGSVEDLSEDSREFLDDDDVTSPTRISGLGFHDSRQHHPGNYAHGNHQTQVETGSRVPSVTSYPEEVKPKSAPASPIRQPHRRHGPRATTPSPSPSRQSRDPTSTGGYIPNSVYATRTQYRTQTYPTFTSRSSTYSTPPPPHQAQYSPTTPQEDDYHQQRYQHPLQPNAHNLYNLNSHSSSRYDSADELKSPEEYDRHWPSKHGSLEGAYRKRGGGREMSSPGLQYSNSNLDHQSGGSVDLLDLAPTKFGSKRESHSDYRDSPYHNVDGMVPRMRGDEGCAAYPPPRGVRGDMGGDHFHRSGSMPPTIMDRSYSPSMGTSGGVAYSDSSQSSGGNNMWYQNPDDPRPLHVQQGHHQHPHQAAPPMSPQYEAPSHQISYEGVDLSLAESPSAVSPTGDTPQQATVTKYQNYVEVSKPFEMADYYKYSERLRKQRGPDSRGHASPNRLQSPTTPVYRSGSRSSQGQSRSRPNSPHSQPDFSDSLTPGQTHAQNSSPIYNVPPSPQYPQQYATTPGPSSVTSHGVQSTGPSYATTPTPRHVAYQPPQPMTCEAVPQPQASSSVSDKRLSDLRGSPARGSSPLADMGVAGEFSEEMLAWYNHHGGSSQNTCLMEPQSGSKPATLV